jgi:hypothetical protein
VSGVGNRVWEGEARAEPFVLSFVAVAAGNNHHVTFGHGVHEAVLVVDAPRPTADKFTLERLRLADSSERGSYHVLNKLIEPFEQFPVVALKPKIVAPGRKREDEPQGCADSRSWVAPLPASDRDLRK